MSWCSHFTDSLAKTNRHQFVADGPTPRASGTFTVHELRRGYLSEMMTHTPRCKWLAYNHLFGLVLVVCAVVWPLLRESPRGENEINE